MVRALKSLFVAVWRQCLTSCRGLYALEEAITADQILPGHSGNHRRYDMLGSRRYSLCHLEYHLANRLVTSPVPLSLGMHSKY